MNWQLELEITGDTLVWFRGAGTVNRVLEVIHDMQFKDTHTHTPNLNAIYMGFDFDCTDMNRLQTHKVLSQRGNFHDNLS